MTAITPAAAPDNLRGIVWMIATAFFFTCMMAEIRILSTAFSTPQIVLLRSAVGAALFLPAVMRGGLVAFVPVRPVMFPVRAVVLMGGMLFLFHGISLMPFSDAIAINFTVPLFTVVAAVILLRERVSWQLAVAVLVGFAGVLVITRPGVGTFQPAALLVLAASMFYALDNICVKVLGRTESTVRIVFYMHALSLVIAAVISVFDWRAFRWDLWPEILLLGVLGSAAHFSLAKSFFYGHASVVSPFAFTRLPVGAGLAWVLFGEPTDLWTWLGAAIIFGATSYIARREGRANRPG